MVDVVVRWPQDGYCWGQFRVAATETPTQVRVGSVESGVYRGNGGCAGSGDAVSGTVSPISSADELLLITFSLQSCPTSQTPKPGVSHVRLTERAPSRHVGMACRSVGPATR